MRRRHSQQRERLALELSLARAHRPQLLEHDAAKLTAGVGQVVRHVRHRNAERRRQLGIGPAAPWVAVGPCRLELVELEQPEMRRLATRLALGAQLRDRETEQAADELALEELIRPLRSRRFDTGELPFGPIEVEPSKFFARL